MLLMLLVGLLQITGPADKNLLQESKTQAKYYISNIENGKNSVANAWALATLTSDKEHIRNFVEREIREKGKINSTLSLFKKIAPQYTDQLYRIVFKTGSSNLLIDLLLSTGDENKKREIYQKFLNQFNHKEVNGIKFDALCQTLIKGKLVSNDFLSSKSFRLPHFFLLFRNYKLIPKKYLDEIIGNWGPDKYKNDLDSSLFKASYLRALYLNYQYPKTSLLYNNLANDTKFPNSNLKLRVYIYLDYSMYSLGYYDRSLTVLRNFTLPLSKYLNKTNKYLEIRQLQGVYLYRIGKIKTAKKILEEVLKETESKNVQIPRSSLYNNLALAYYKTGDYNKYLDLQFQALETARKTDNYKHQLNVYNNLFVYHRKNNDLENALLYLEKAQNLAKRENKTEELGRIYTLHGSFYRDFKKDYEVAHQYFSNAEKILSPNENANYYIDLLRDQAETYEEQSLYTKALQKRNQIIKLVSTKNQSTYINTLVDKAVVFLKIGDLNETNQLLKKFKAFDLSQIDFDKLIKAKTVEADYLKRTNYPNRAIAILEPTLQQIVSRARSSTDLKSGFWHVEDEYLDAFELAVSIYMENGKPEKAIEKLDQLKTINDASFYQNPLVKSSLLNESELTEYKKLTAQLDVTRKKLLTAPESQQFDIQQRISQLKLKKRKLDRKLTKDIDSNPISIQEVQNKLSARELVMHITELNDQYYVAKISRSDVKIETIPLNSELRNLLTGSAQQIATHQTNLDSLYKISRVLGIQKIPDRIEQITLIPDSYFYQLPIDVLPLKKPDHSYSYGEVTYAIENFRTQYLTSLADFRSSQDSERLSNNKLNYVGYGVSNFSGYNKKSLVPLPFAQKEVSSIANKLTHLPNIQTYINEQSTKTVFIKTAPNARIIHLATHSEVSERDPMFSTVYLSKAQNSPDSTFDDQIFAYELFELNLSNEMIMLNSCESGSGSYIQGTGVMGISRALQYAGARSLILNLWSVNDMLASDFAIHFYDQLNQGKSKAEALRNTKRYFLRTKNASPHFWGPYMLIGDTNPIVKPNRDKNLAMASAFIFYFLLMIALSYLTQQGYIFHNQERKLLK